MEKAIEILEKWLLEKIRERILIQTSYEKAESCSEEWHDLRDENITLNRVINTIETAIKKLMEAEKQ